MKTDMKRLPKLSKRLAAIADFVPENSRIADIGTDHAYIPVYLTLKGTATYAVASDVKKGPLVRANSTITQFNAEDLVETRLGNGLESLTKGEIDTVIIAGMGGILISNILESAKELLKEVKTLILQPMTAVYELRKYLNENNYIITDEALVKEDNKLYTVIKAEHGFEQINKDLYFYIGKKLTEKKDILLPELIDRNITKFTKQINGLSSTEITDENLVKINNLKQILKEMQKLKICGKDI